MSGASDDSDLLAGEYALGCLDAAAMRSVEAKAGTDTTLQRAIQTWMARLAPLAATVSPVAPPPALWLRLAASIGEAPIASAVAPVSTQPTAATLMPDNVMPLRAPRRDVPSSRPWQHVGFWRGTTVAALAVAAALAGIIVARPPTPAGPAYLAALTAPGAPVPAFMARSRPDGSITVAALNAPPAVPGRDMELWALPHGAARPTSLGVMPATGKRIDALTMPRDQTQLMVSLEPTGGSPTGLPTGQVIFAGLLTGVN